MFGTSVHADRHFHASSVESLSDIWKVPASSKDETFLRVFFVWEADSMKRRRNTRNRRRIQLIAMFVCFLLCTGFAVQNSARKIDAESDLTRISYKYYKSYYVETGDSLWSIAKEHISDEYSDINEYIAEVKQINHLQGDAVKQGSHICIPYYSMEHK